MSVTLSGAFVRPRRYVNSSTAICRHHFSVSVTTGRCTLEYHHEVDSTNFWVAEEGLRDADGRLVQLVVRRGRAVDAKSDRLAVGVQPNVPIGLYQRRGLCSA